MIHSLEFEVTFANNETKRGNYDFPEGVTVISGPNEKGKSLILEMIRAAFFGVKALRASASSYHTLDITMTFEIMGAQHTVSRSLTGAKLDDTVTGTTAVNETIVELLGFNYDVFLIANACLQGQVAALSDMKPAARKRMVDSLVGLDRLTSPEKKVTAELSTIRNVLKALPLVERPIEPNRPKGRRLASIRGDISRLIVEEREYGISKWAMDNQILPPAVVEPPGEKPVHTGPPYTGPMAKPKAVSPPKLMVQDPEGLKAEWAAYRAAKARAKNNQFISCPKCGEEIPLGAVNTVGAEPTVPLYAAEDTIAYNNYLLKQEQWDLNEKAKPQQLLLEQYYKDEAAYESYQKENSRYEEYAKDISHHVSIIHKFSSSREDLKVAREAETMWTEYNYDLKVYKADADRYEAYLKRKISLLEQEKDYKNARKALTTLRGYVKTYLIPSLNSVASKLLSDMTSGTRTSITIDDEFNIKVDSNPIETLSGSTLAVANIALRISLGRVLTSKVFSVFMGDELDAAMDDNRAKDTLECLKSLKTQQVILVSHKPLQANNCLTI